MSDAEKLAALDREIRQWMRAELNREYDQGQRARSRDAYADALFPKPPTELDVELHYDRLYPQAPKELTRGYEAVRMRLVDAAAGLHTSPASGLVIYPNDEAVLLYLLEMHPRLRQQEDIAVGAGVSRPTARKSIKRLLEAGMVFRPMPRSGVGLTTNGSALAARIARR
jgi:DNA-binding MarR family transcriptional regulator